jgi:hypothetical protein
MQPTWNLHYIWLSNSQTMVNQPVDLPLYVLCPSFLSSQVRVVTTREYLRRRSETFCRVSPAQLHELFTEYEDDIGEQGAACEAMPLYTSQSTWRSLTRIHDPFIARSMAT